MSCRSQIKRPPERTLAAAKSCLPLAVLPFHLSVHLPAERARGRVQEALDKFSLTGTLRNVTSQAVACVPGGRGGGRRKASVGSEASSTGGLCLARPWRSETPWGQELK